MTSVQADPYWKWAEATDYRHTGIADRTGSWWVQILLELILTDAQPNPATGLNSHLQTRPPRGFVPKPYRKAGVQYCTAWIARDEIANLPPTLVRRFKLGLAANTADKSTEFFSETYIESGGRPPPFKGEAVVLATIDDYVNYSHHAFSDTNGKSRFRLVWDQAGNLARASGSFNWPNYGYAKLLGDVRPWSSAHNKIRASHGTHVAGLAGGTVTPGFRMRKSSPHLFADAPEVDAASNAPMAVVMLPNSTVADTSGGALGVNVLDALTFLLDNIDTDTHLLVNLSFGTMSGAHDGSGVLESAISELMAKRLDKLTVVLPSGNSFESQCHAQFSLGAKENYPLVWRVLPEDKTCSFLELWLPNDANTLVCLESPSGKLTRCLKKSDDSVLLEVGGSVIAGLWHDAPVTLGGKKRVLVALAPTRSSGGEPYAPHGDWTVTITNLEDEPVELIQAWVERDNASFGQRTRGRQSYLVDPGIARQPTKLATTAMATTKGITGFGSLNAIGTFAAATVVSGYNLQTRAIANYSGAGSTHLAGVRTPSYAAPSEESLMLRGLPGIGNAANSVVRLGGTSVAAPYATRLLFNQLVVPSQPNRQPAPPTPDARIGTGLI